MQLDKYEALVKKMASIKEDVSQNQGRLSQLKETGKKKYKVNSITELKELKQKKETLLEMQQAKKKIKMNELEKIVPEDVLDELLND